MNSAWRRARLALVLLACAGATAMPVLGAGAGVRPVVGAAPVGPAPRYAAAGAAPVGPAPPYAAAGGRYVTLLFSRSQKTAADNCVPDDTAIARIDTVVAPYLRSLGMAGTGTLVTAKTQAGAMCTHYGESLLVSWADAARLAQVFGWSFGSATATYPSDLSQLTPAQAYQETCGSAATIDAHGLPGGHGIIDYPGAQPLPQSIQVTDGARCFAWGRQYDTSGTTLAAAGQTPPYWQLTRSLNGGHCNDPAAPCYTAAKVGYTSPNQIIALVDALKPGQWLTIQAYLLVTGTNPPYTTNQTRWDCTSANPDLHWTNDNERYCYSDWQKIVAAIAARPNLTVTDPLTVGMAFGRPATYP